MNESREMDAWLARSRLVHNLTLYKRPMFPEVKMVTSLLFRRQYYRSLKWDSLGILLRDCLMGPRNFRHESWQEHFGLHQEGYDRAFGPLQVKSTDEESVYSDDIEDTTFEAGLPPSLESLHLFEDFNEAIYGNQSFTRPRQSRLCVLKGLATSVPGIKHLSVSFLIDTTE